MKIHIVQKGDTLRKLGEQYGVNLEELKKANSQLPNPDMIMPGMKIKIPTGAVQAKNTGSKEMVKAQAVTHLPKMEVPKVEMPKVDYAKLRSMVKEAVDEQLPALLRSAMNEQVVNERKEPYEKVKALKPAPPPVKEMPMPYKPEKVMPIMEVPCPPFPPSHYMMHGYPMPPMGLPAMEQMDQDFTYGQPYDDMTQPYEQWDQEMAGMPQPYGQWDQHTGGMPQPYGQWDQQTGGMQPYGQWDQQTGGMAQPYGQWDQQTGGMAQPYGQWDQQTGEMQPYGQWDQQTGGMAQPYGQWDQQTGGMAQPYGQWDQQMGGVAPTGQPYGGGMQPYGGWGHLYGTMTQPSTGMPYGTPQTGRGHSQAPFTREGNEDDDKRGTLAVDERNVPTDIEAKEEPSVEDVPKSVSKASSSVKSKASSKKSKR